MTMPLRYAHASEEFDRFLVDARDTLGLHTRHQTYTAVQAVAWVFRRRLDVGQVVAFAQFLPPVFSAIFLQGWNPADPPAPFGEPETWSIEVRAVRAGHNFAPDDAVPRVAAALRRHVDVQELDALLERMPPAARRFWAPTASSTSISPSSSSGA